MGVPRRSLKSAKTQANVRKIMIPYIADKMRRI
jgi:hypothetical protein